MLRVNNSIHCRCLVNKARGQMVASLQKFLIHLNKYRLLKVEISAQSQLKITFWGGDAV